jgi:hypothetical protein
MHLILQSLLKEDMRNLFELSKIIEIDSMSQGHASWVWY